MVLGVLTALLQRGRVRPGKAGGPVLHHDAILKGNKLQITQSFSTLPLTSEDGISGSGE